MKVSGKGLLEGHQSYTLAVTVLPGIGDSLLHYPDLIRQLSGDELRVIDRLPRPYIAVHPFASQENKAIPMPDKLLKGLVDAGVNVVLLGKESLPKEVEGIIRLPSVLRLQIEAAMRATKFIGALSCFNCAAQIAKVPSFVLVNNAVKDPPLYQLMAENGVRVEPINGTKMLAQIYDEAVKWAVQC